LLHLALTVFVTSKSCIYITPNEVALPPKAAQQISDRMQEPNESEPIYENIENGNIVPSDDNKFTIYVNYDFIRGKCKTSNKSSVRVLEPDVLQIQVHAKANDNDDNDVENDSETTSKMIQCQQISMYIGEKI